MLYFKDIQNNIHATDDVKFKYLLPLGSIEISDNEYVELIKPTLDFIKSKQILLVTESHDGYIYSNYTYNGSVFQGDKDSQAKLANATIGTVEVPFWLDVNNVKIDMTREDLIAMIDVIKTRTLAAFIHLQELKSQIREAVDEYTVLGVTW